MFAAVTKEQFESVKLLIRRGSNVNKLNSMTGRSILHNARISNVQIIMFLLSSGANINAVDFQGHIPLMKFIATAHWVSLKKYEKEYLRCLLEYSDLSIDSNDPNQSGYKVLFPKKGALEVDEFLWTMVLEHVAKLQVLNIPVHSNLIDNISKNAQYTNYFKHCTFELEKAKNQKMENSWVTFLNLLVDGEKKLEKYAGNIDLVRHYNRCHRNKEFPIYRSLMQGRMKKAIETRENFDKSTVYLSHCLPIFNPTHLIITDILDCLTGYDYCELQLYVFHRLGDSISRQLNC